MVLVGRINHEICPGKQSAGAGRVLSLVSTLIKKSEILLRMRPIAETRAKYVSIVVHDQS